MSSVIGYLWTLKDSEMSLGLRKTIVHSYTWPGYYPCGSTSAFGSGCVNGMGGAVTEFGFITDVHSQHITRTLALELGA